MDSNRQHVMALLARGGVPALACLCCSFCTADPDVVFWTLASGDGTHRDGGGVAGADDAAGEVTLDAEIRQKDGGTRPDLDAGLAPIPPWCIDGGLSNWDCELPPWLFFDGGTYASLQDTIASYDAGTDLTLVRVEGIEQCGDAVDSYYVDDSGPWPRYIACPKACQNINFVSSFLLRVIFGCEDVYGR
jgi:hypothetical protein